jgi:glycosyltransferase involved in cell wall biosynthesis
MIVAWKGWHLMMEALAGLPASVRDRIHFTHIGSPDGTADSEAYAASLYARTTHAGLGSNVTWLGEQTTSRALLEQCDCAVVLSHQEPFSMVMLEALALGVPVLASKAGGPGDVLEPGINGWFFRPDDVDDLARQLARLVESDALRSVRIKADSIRRFDSAVVAAQWAQIYERAIAGTPLSSAATA